MRHTSDRLRARESFELRSEYLQKMIGGIRRSIARPRKRELKGQSILRLKARIDAKEAGKRADHQAGSSEKHESEAHFTNNQDLAEPLTSRIGTSRSFLQKVNQIRARGCEGGSEAKQNRGNQRKCEGEHQDRGIQPNRNQARNSFRLE